MKTSRQPLDAAALQQALTGLPAWRLHEGKLQRDLRFPDFARAFAFLTAVALRAEANNHHPDWRNSYDRVWIQLSTHDAGGITALDVELAQAIDKLAGAALPA